MNVGELTTLPDLVRRAATEFSEAPALESAHCRESRLSYKQLLDRVGRGASTLQALELAEGDRVLLALESRPEWAAAFFATLQAGLVVVPVPADTPPPAVAAVAAHGQTRAVIFSDRTKQLVGQLTDVARIDVQQLFATDTPAAGMNAAHGLAMLAFTSGSTQHPRAVELTHENLLSNLDGLLRVRRGAPGDVLLSMLPPAHLFELMVGLLAPLACGARVVYATSALPNRLVDALREHHITHAPAVPALVGCLYDEVVSQLIDAGLLDPKRSDENPAETARRIRWELTFEQLQPIRRHVWDRIGAALKTLIVGGAALNPAVAEVLAALDIRTEVGYGLTEASPVVSVGLYGQCPAGSVGRPLPGVEVRIDPRGEILVRGPNVMQGYHNDPQATRAVLKDGWLKTGDLGHFDADGFLFVTGRFKEAMVTAAGQTIYPEEVEPYYQDPLFAELCVTARRGDDGNDLPTLFVVPASPEATNAQIDDAFANLRAAAPSRLRLDQVVRLSHPLPRTASGKIRRRYLAEQFDPSQQQS